MKVLTGVLFFVGVSSVALSRSTTHSQSQRLPLKFGAEFEFIFPDSSLSVPDDDKIKQINWHLQNHGITPGQFFDYDAAHIKGATSKWKIVPDESLTNGFELVSPPINDVGQVRAALDAMAEYGAQLSAESDFHVHVDVSNRSVEEVRNVLKNFVMFESTMDQSQPPNHQGNSNVWMQSNAGHFPHPEVAYTAFDLCDTLHCLYQASQPMTGLGSRVHKLNLAEHKDSVTLEFRGHHGTVDANTAVNWIKLVNMFVRNSFEPGRVAKLEATLLTPLERVEYMFKLLLENNAEIKEAYVHRIFDQQFKAITSDSDSIYNKKVVNPYI